MIISCTCCGHPCLEVKCPFSCCHLSPMDSDTKLAYFRRMNDVVSMNYNHKYYTRCHGSNSSIEYKVELLLCLDCSWILL